MLQHTKVNLAHIVIIHNVKYRRQPIPPTLAVTGHTASQNTPIKKEKDLFPRPARHVQLVGRPRRLDRPVDEL